MGESQTIRPCTQCELAIFRSMVGRRTMCNLRCRLIPYIYPVRHTISPTSFCRFIHLCIASIFSPCRRGSPQKGRGLIIMHYALCIVHCALWIIPYSLLQLHQNALSPWSVSAPPVACSSDRCMPPIPFSDCTPTYVLSSLLLLSVARFHVYFSYSRFFLLSLQAVMFVTALQIYTRFLDYARK